MDRRPERRSWIVGNWKMHGLRASLAAVVEIDRAAQACGEVDVALALPFTLIHAAAQAVSHIAIGGQNCHTQPQGAYTGDISAAMLHDSGADCVILGHSERRLDCGETDEIVRDKLHTALSSGLTVILCLGEHLAEREAGLAEDKVRQQLTHALTGLTPSPDLARHLAIAYEPIWAIGTGLVPEAPAIAAMHGAIRQSLAQALGPSARTIRLLYGGSVDEGNAPAILRLADVDGALVGNASLDSARFAAIIQAAQDIRDA
ncbi:triose-phosphate isomerase [Novosphingobium terrae]|uniref:triose-phosphate isomerase n=1 Tax=Novosphingobium terrae TaxID=2726189 RepID=UPI00197D600B|nr:triose-phosphate isomerase [Novosphingobium terrae]